MDKRFATKGKVKIVDTPYYRDGSKVNIGDLVLFESEKANLYELCEVIEIWEQDSLSPSENVVLRSTFDKCDFSYRSYDIDFVVKRVGE